MTEYIGNKETINQIAERFCNSMESCSECPYGMGNELGMDRCLVKQLSMITYPFESITEFLKKWARENPKGHRKTYADDFLDKHPSAQLIPWYHEKIPATCKCAVYSGRKPYLCTTSCRDCWLKPFPEETAKG